MEETDKYQENLFYYENLIHFNGIVIHNFMSLI
jgi:hypothetical protein